MQDFAAAAMMRLVAAGLARQGIAPPPLPARGPHVPLSAKRVALAQIAAAQGRRALLGIADALPEMPPEPALRVMRLARGPADLLARWTRLEGFVHSRHRVAWRDDGPAGIALSHRSTRDDAPPTAEESLLVFAVLSVLAESLGLVAAGPDGAEPWRLHGRWTEAAGRGAAPDWRLQVTPAPPAPRPARSPGGIADACRALVAADPAGRWTVGLLSDVLGIAPRTLQRRLAAEGSSFSTILTSARVDAAASMLDSGTTRLAEVAFASGFADQAHLTRAFRHSAALTPAAYRVLFMSADR